MMRHTKEDRIDHNDDDDEEVLKYKHNDRKLLMIERCFIFSRATLLPLIAVLVSLLILTIPLFLIHDDSTAMMELSFIKDRGATKTSPSTLLSFCSYDVLIYDSTPSGIMAAVAAARLFKMSNKFDKNRCKGRVGILSPTHHIGGMVSGGLGASDVGKYPSKTIGGLALEFFQRCRNESTVINNKNVDGHDISPWNVEPHVAQKVFRQMLQEVGVDVLEETGYVTDVIRMENGRRVTTIKTTYNLTFEGSIFVDASYEGDVLTRAGVPYDTGRESATRYNESYGGNLIRNDGHRFPISVNPFVNNGTDGELLPYLITNQNPGAAGEDDTKIQSYNFRLCVTKTPDNAIPFPKPNNYQPYRWELMRRYVQKLIDLGIVDKHLKVPSPSLGPLPNYKYDCNNAGPLSTDFVGGSWKYINASYEERSEIWEDHKQYMLELFWFLRNDPSIPIRIKQEMSQWGLCMDEFIDTDNWPPQLYVRESRRMIGMQVFTQQSIDKQKNGGSRNSLGLSSIGLGSYNYDSHTAQRFPVILERTDKNNGRNTPVAATRNEGDLERSPGLIYQIPLQILFPKKQHCTNLVVPVCVSASHVAFNTLRMEPQFMIMGQAAGTIAALTLLQHHARSAEAIVQNIDLQLLRDYLLQTGQIVEVPASLAGLLRNKMPTK